MTRSAELFERAKRLSPGGVHSPVRAFKGLNRPPLFFQQAQGAKLIDVDGHEYIDFCQSFGPNILGHRDPDVAQAVEEVIHQVWTLGAAAPYALELEEWIAQRIPWAQKLRFVNSGTEAVMSALRLARGFTGRDLILKFAGCYHGHVDSMLVKAGSGLAGVATSSSAGVSAAVAAQTLVAPLDNEEETLKLIKEYGPQIAAIIIEPLPANNGLLPQRRAFLQQLRQWANEIGALLIFDEVISGFRVDIQGMSGKLDITPDLVTYGKIIGGGFPVGCYAGRADIMDHIAPLGDVYQAGTLSANPVCMATGLATLQKIEQAQVIPALRENTNYFAQQVSALFERYQLPYYITHHESLFWIHANKEQQLTRPEQITHTHTAFFASFFPFLLERGIYMAPHAYEISFMSLAHTRPILEQTLNVIEDFARQQAKSSSPAAH